MPGRPPHQPVHVTFRAVKGLPSFRSPRVFPPLREALAAGSRAAFRVCHFSVQSNHVHLLVEADSREALMRGARGLAIRTARAVNRVLGRCGQVWSDRYHARALTTPREVRNALVYVLNNWRKHGHGQDTRETDPCSSGAGFTGWRERVAGPPPGVREPMAAARTWLLGAGWKRHGPIDGTERPRG